MSMGKTKHRTSFALDEATAERIQRLARRWGVSQAEVVRRAVRLAADQSETEGSDVRERVARYRSSGRISQEQADEFLRQVAEDRASWGRDR